MLGAGDCPSTIGIRVHSAQVDQQSFYWTTGASGKEYHSSVQFVDVNSPSGRIYVGLDDSNLSCAWWAKQIRIEKRDTTWKTFTWGAQTSSARDQMAFSGFESTGACEPYFETSVLSFHTQDYWSYTNDVVFHHGLDIQAGQVSLESAVWLAGTPKHTGGSSTYFYSFQVDPLLTAPWVIGP